MRSFSHETEILMQFLAFRPDDSVPVLQKFAGLDGAISHFDGEKKGFVYVPGTREDRVVLAAHTDTVWDKLYWGFFLPEIDEKELLEKEHRPVLSDGIVRQGGWNGWGLGADDRAGCAMLWLLRNSGHSLLLTDGEEHGQIGANHLMRSYPEIADELNSHNYMIQLDRRNDCDYKTYDLSVSREFIDYVESQTGYMDAGRRSRTDIVALCKRICGVNFSIGYYTEHYADDYLDVDHWLNTYRIVKSMLEKKQPRFLLEGSLNDNGWGI